VRLEELKLYFMVGLPTETDEDLQGIGSLVNRVLDVARANRSQLTLNVTISPFVPSRTRRSNGERWRVWKNWTARLHC